MRRSFKIAIVTAITSLFLLSSLVNAGPRAFTFFPATGTTNAIVQQQTTIFNTVTNPTNCVWSGYDTRRALGQGFLRSHTSESAQVCVIEDNLYHGITAYVNAPSNALTITLTVGSTTFNLSPTPDPLNADRYTYYTATQTPSLDVNTLPVIAGSNGGRGIQVNVTLTVNNTSGHNLTTDASASLNILSH